MVANPVSATLSNAPAEHNSSRINASLHKQSFEFNNNLFFIQLLWTFLRFPLEDCQWNRKRSGIKKHNFIPRFNCSCKISFPWVHKFVIIENDGKIISHKNDSRSIDNFPPASVFFVFTGAPQQNEAAEIKRLILRKRREKMKIKVRKGMFWLEVGWGSFVLQEFVYLAWWRQA